MKENMNYINALPDFLAMQRISFCWFITQGLSEELASFSRIQDFSQNTEYILFGEEYNLIKPSYSFEVRGAIELQPVLGGANEARGLEADEIGALGFSLGGADLDADSFDDVVIGAPTSSPGNDQNNTGAGVVVYGGAMLPGLFVVDRFGGEGVTVTVGSISLASTGDVSGVSASAISISS